jgi:hypothetical protein
VSLAASGSLRHTAQPNVAGMVTCSSERERGEVDSRLLISSIRGVASGAATSSSWADGLGFRGTSFPAGFDFHDAATTRLASARRWALEKEGGAVKRLLRTRTICIGVAAIIAALAMGVGTARAGNFVVHFGSCVAFGGNTTVPAGSSISMFAGIFEVNRGLAQNWLNDQTTTVSVNGGPPVNVNSLYGAPTQQPDGTWLGVFTYPTGITLANPGDSLTFTMTVTLAHLLAEEVNGPVGFRLGFAPGTVFFTPAGTGTASCTVAAT